MKKLVLYDYFNMEAKDFLSEFDNSKFLKYS